LSCASPKFICGEVYIERMKYLYYYIIIINIFAFSLMGIDKYKAKKHGFRISEKALFASAIIGGSIGALAGMKNFHHKTKHQAFKIGIPSILLIQIALAIYIYYKFIS